MAHRWQCTAHQPRYRTTPHRAGIGDARRRPLRIHDRAFEDLLVDGYAEYEGEDYPVSTRYRNGMKRVTVEGVLEKVNLGIEKYVVGSAGKT